MLRIFDIFNSLDLTSSTAGGISETGEPLAEHPDWELLYTTTGNDEFGWRWYGERIYAKDTTSSNTKLCFKKDYGDMAIMEADFLIDSSFGTEDGNYPFMLSKFNLEEGDAELIVGLRFNKGVMQIAKKETSSWVTDTIAGSDTWVAPYHIEAWIYQNKVDVYKDDVLVHTFSHAFGSAGYYGIKGAAYVRTGDLDYVSNYKVTVYSNSQTPCMTNYEVPYGHAESTYVFSGSYPAWRGMDCVETKTNAWVTPVWDYDDPDTSTYPNIEAGDVWVGWWLRDQDLATGMSVMYPTELYIKPRPIGGSWNADNNPVRFRVLGIDADMNEVVLIDEYYESGWIGTNPRELDLEGTTPIPLRGYKLVVTGTNAYENPDKHSFHTGISHIRMNGVYGGDDNTTAVTSSDGFFLVDSTGDTLEAA